MKVKMLRTEKGSIDGIKVQSYDKGQIYDLPEKLAKIFVTIKAAQFCQEEIVSVSESTKAKDMKQAPENKVAKEELKEDKKEDGKK